MIKLTYHLFQLLNHYNKKTIIFLMFMAKSVLNRLLDVLAGRKKTEFLTGNILFNNQKLPKNFKRISGYITQVKFNLSVV